MNDKKTEFLPVFLFSAVLLYGLCAVGYAEMVSNWKCDEAPGSVSLSDSIGIANGTLTGLRINFVTSGAGVSGGGFGNAVWTDNLNDYVTLSNVSGLNFAKTDFAVTGWFKTNNAARHGYILRHGTYDQGGYAVFIFKDSGRLGFQVYGPSANVLLLSDTAIHDGAWHWFGARVAGQKLYLYVDGQLQSQSGMAYSTQTTATAATGSTTMINQNMAGLVDEICVYNTALSVTLSGSLLTGGQLYQDWYNIPIPGNCGQVIASGYGIAADLNRDCYVNMVDLEMLAAEWFNTRNMDIPVFWCKPATFDPNVSGLGLEPLAGITHLTLYDPLASSACISEGGSGAYESLTHGTYNHHPQLIVLGQTMIANWTNHAKDENGPGQRMLAKLGTFDAAMGQIDWGGSETLVEIAPAPAPVDRRLYNHNPSVISEIFAKGDLKVINGKLYSTGQILAIHGWTNDPLYSGVQSAPVPADKWRLNYDAAGGFTLDVWWKLADYYQRWQMGENGLEPNTTMYKSGALATQIEVTPGNFKPVVSCQEPYKSAPYLATAPWEFRNDLNQTPEPFTRTAYFESSVAKRAATDGINGLAHIAVFQRPDGKWTVLRDNLSNAGYYYAAQIEDYEDYCPPACPTNLYGTAQPDARELPDGRPYILGNSIGRKDMFITISADGSQFDRTWLLLHSDRVKSDDGLFKSGGPQYFRSLVVGDNIWVIYSITKELIGMTKIPAGVLD